MAVPTAAIVANADVFRRAYPDWPHAAPMTTTPAPQGGTMTSTAPEQAPQDGPCGRQEQWCGAWFPGQCLNEQPHAHHNWQNGRVTWHCEGTPAVAEAPDFTRPLEGMGERPFSPGLCWTCDGPKGAIWVIAWNPSKDRGQVRAWRFPSGRVAYWGDAGDAPAARAEAVRIAALIAAGKAA